MRVEETPDEINQLLKKFWEVIPDELLMNYLPLEISNMLLILLGHSYLITPLYDESD